MIQLKMQGIRFNPVEYYQKLLEDCSRRSNGVKSRTHGVIVPYRCRKADQAIGLPFFTSLKNRRFLAVCRLVVAVR